MSCQSRNKVQRSTNNRQTSTSQTEGVKFENKRKKRWCSCIFKIISLVKKYFKMSRVHLKFRDEQFRVTKSETVTEVLIKTGVFWNVAPCRIVYVVCVCVYTIVTNVSEQPFVSILRVESKTLVWIV